MLGSSYPRGRTAAIFMVSFIVCVWSGFVAPTAFSNPPVPVALKPWMVILAALSGLVCLLTVMQAWRWFFNFIAPTRTNK